MCQFWLNESAGTLTSPYFDGLNQAYGHNLNCTWNLLQKDGFYINLEITYFRVKSQKDLQKSCHVFLKIILVTVGGWRQSIYL